MHRQIERISRLAGLFCLAVLLPAAAIAQEGSIAGIVQDSSGGVLPGVTVEVRSPALIEGVRTTATETNGRYTFVALPVGTYEVRYSFPGFNAEVREGIAITTGFTATLNLTLRPGDVTEVLTVSGESPTVDVTRPGVAIALTGEDLRELPTSRNLSSLMVLVPGITFQTGGLANQPGGICVGGVGTFCTPTVGGFGVHGADNTTGEVRVAGAVLNTASATYTGNLAGYVVDVANAQEVSFNLTGALGESEGGGASINIVPRTGGNTFRGSYSTGYTTARWFDRNNRTRATAAPASFPYDYDVSGSFGGPILRDRLWFHSVLRTQEKEEQRSSPPLYYNLNAGIWAANYLPDRSRGRVNYTNEYRNANVRLTLQVTPRNKVNLFWDEQETCLDPCDGAVSSWWSPEAQWSVRTLPNRLWQGTWTNPLTNRLLLEGRINMVAQHYNFAEHKYVPNPQNIPSVNEGQQQGCCVGRDDVALTVNSSLSGTANDGANNCFATATSFCSGSLTSGNFDRNGNARPALTLSYITGSHNARIGYEGSWNWVRRVQHRSETQLMYNMQTPPATCYNAAAPELSTCGKPHPMYAASDPYNSLRRPVPISYAMNAGRINFDDRLTTQAIYAQDQWTVNRFTINAAIRYDHASSNYLPTCLEPNVFVSEDKAWCSPPNNGPSFHDVTPRWGVAWDVFGDGKTAIKWNMGKYLNTARLAGVFNDANLGRGSSLTTSIRGWEDGNGNRLIDCDLYNPAEQNNLASGGDRCAATNAANLAALGRNPTHSFTGTFFCGQQRVKREEDGFISPDWGLDYCGLADQDLYSGSGSRRYNWQFGLGIQREILPRLSAEVTYNQRWDRNLQVTDQIGIGCDLYDLTNFDAGHEEGPIDVFTGTTAGCRERLFAYDHPHYSFYQVRAPVDPRFPDGGGYMVIGRSDRSTETSLTNRGTVATLQVYGSGWRGIDTNFVLRARGGLRLNGGTSTGGSFSDSCVTINDAPGTLLARREGNELSCRRNEPYQTNIRGSVAYTIPWVDVLASAVFQSRPGPARSANVTYRVTEAVQPSATAVFDEVIEWEPTYSAWRATNSVGCPQLTTGANPQPSPVAVGCLMGSSATTVTVNVLDSGDLYGSRYNMVDLKLGKNIRFARRRLNIGVDIYNLFNSDAAVGYNNTYNPQQWSDEHGNAYQGNVWGAVTSIVNPRFARFVLQFDF